MPRNTSPAYPPIMVADGAIPHGRAAELFGLHPEAPAGFNQQQLQAAIAAGGLVSLLSPGIYPMLADTFQVPAYTSLTIGPNVMFSIDGKIAPLRSLMARTPPILTTTPTVVCLSDSIGGYNTTNTATEQSFSAFGFMAWAQALLQGKIDFPLAGNLGVTGDRIDQALYRIASVFALQPSYCAILLGTNDLAQSISFATMRDNMRQLIATLIAGGVVPVVFTVTPRTGLTATQRAVHMNFNSWLRDAFGDSNSVILVDPFRRIADPANANSDPASGMTSDGVHPYQTMAYWMGKEFATAMESRLQPRPAHWQGNADTYDAANNPRGNLLLNSGFTATTPPGTGLTGTTATNWTSTRVAGTGSATIAVQDRTDGVPGKELLLTINVSGQSATEEWKIRQSVAAGVSTYASGDQLFGLSEIEVSASTNLKWLLLYLDDNDGVSVVNTGRALAGASGLMPTAAWSGLLKTPPITVKPYAGSGTQALTLGLDVAVNGTTSGIVTIKWRAPKMRKVITP